MSYENRLDREDLVNIPFDIDILIYNETKVYLLIYIDILIYNETKVSIIIMIYSTHLK